MKLYEQAEPPLLMRVNIKKSGEKTEYITLSDTTQKDVMDFIKGVIEEQKISPFVKGKVTNIEVREYRNGVNGKCISVSFKCIEPKEVQRLIIEKLNHPNPQRI